MDASDSKSWIRAVIVAAVVYLIAGIVFGALSGWSTSHLMRVAWRLAAWLTCGFAYVVHIWHERSRPRTSVYSAALRASLGADLGAFGIAVAANLHALWAHSGNHRSLALALVAFPALTAVPSFVVALAVASGLNLRIRASQPNGAAD